ncbi:MAG TPA: hypothetical protein VI790_02680 [Candidatus Nanoarchaeia archaeon]|nr:hypothetical protein [Candidatus Nanoarchaeia archaeon]
MISRLIGFILILIGVIGALGVLGAANPLSFVSAPLFNLSASFLPVNASFLFWVIIVFMGVSFVAPKNGYLKSVYNLRRR